MMKNSDYSKLEKDYKFKRKYFGKTTWWANGMIVPPSLLIFIGIAGLLYLSAFDLLKSYYTIPYMAVFVIGTLWLKAIKNNILKTAIAKENAFRICLAKPVGEREGYMYAIFFNNDKRQNRHQLHNFGKEIRLDDLDANVLKGVKRKALSLYDKDSDTDYLLKAYPTANIKKCDSLWDKISVFPILYINEANIPIVKRIDLDNIK